MYFFPFSLFVSASLYVSVCDFVCIALFLLLVLGFQPSVLFFFVLFFLVWFLGLFIIGGCVFWFGCSLLSFFHFITLKKF